MKEIKVGKEQTFTHTITEKELAKVIGSGEVEVYSTPMMVAFMVQSAAALIKEDLDSEETSVGILIHTTHQAATPCHKTITCHAKVTAVDRKKVTFQLCASDEKEVIGTAVHERVIVNKERFEARAKAK